MSLVIEGEQLHRLCLMCNPIRYCVIKFMHFIQSNIWIEINVTNSNPADQARCTGYNIMW